ncbi:MAG: stage 0 sporulation protein [Bacilli bacterium]|jgi:cell fate regulator YaaT (PSP1 superfamily)|nr:stage 0 sporulation protein [Bacilli bacterium]
MEIASKYFIGIRFPGGDKSYYFSTDYDDLKIGDKVVVETIAGYEIGEVSTTLMNIATYQSNLDLKPIVRKPTAEDMSDYEFNLKESERALQVTESEVKRLGLPMNLIEANYTLDGSKVTITYTADNRVDFRELLHILAPQLKCRIELRQIASRDKAKMIGGMGICGLTLCCSTFLTQFDGISISRAKNQMLTLNIPKLSGHCGKLICCLLYEDDLYTEAKKSFPRLGTVVHVDNADCKVEGFNILSKTVKLVGLDGIRFVTLDEYDKIAKKSFRPTGNVQPTHNVNPIPTPNFKKHD